MKSKLTKDELKSFRAKEIAISRPFFVLALLLISLYKAEYLSTEYAYFHGFGAFYIFLLFLTGAEYRKYYFLLVPSICILFFLIGGLKGFVLCFMFFFALFFALFFVSMWLGKRSFEKKKGIKHSW